MILRDSLGREQTSQSPSPALRHEVELRGLVPAREYTYQVWVDGKPASQSFDFRTAPAGPTPLRFALHGDSGSGLPEQHAVARAIEQSKPDLVVHTGDLIYERGADADYDAKFFRPYRTLVARIPMYITLGNHDYLTPGAQPYLNNLVLPTNPAGHERWYAFTYGFARFVCLDSNLVRADFARSEQGRWFAAEVAKPWSGWTIVFFHHPLYSGARRPEMRRDDVRRRALMSAVLEVPGVDLILGGHYHSYQRMHPVSHTGKRRLVHITSGGGGARLYPVNPEPYIAASRSAFHFVLFEVESATKMRLAAMEVDEGGTGAAGTVFDRVTLRRADGGVFVEE